MTQTHDHPRHSIRFCDPIVLSLQVRCVRWHPGVLPATTTAKAQEQELGYIRRLIYQYVLLP
jgi:hypothetical protein